jgi:flagellar hook assembly protein FlgD
VSGFTTITVYDITGKKLETLTSGILKVGLHTISWNASSYPSGMYLIKMVSGEYVGMRKLNLIK